MEQFNIPVSMLRQQCFCPRIPFFQLMRGIQPKGPIWLQQGLNHHLREDMLAKRRKLIRFGITAQNFRFLEEVQLYDDNLGLHGVCDGVIITDNEIIPIEFKLSEGTPAIGARLQLAAYAMLLEHKEKKHVDRGFILCGQKGRTLELPIDAQIRNDVLSAAKQIRETCGKAVIPCTAATEHQCAQCEFQNFCADRL